MTSGQKVVLIVLLIIAAAYFCLFIPPNNTGAKDAVMISLFETDEFAQYPVVVKMLRPRETLDKTILNFVAYRHYYYGSPFYFGSALVVLPVAVLQGLGNTQLNMLLLRQLISVLPMVAALLLLTFLQTRFRSMAASIAVFLLLLAVPAVVENDLWWHVDSLAFLFVVLTFFFLSRDDLRFGSGFFTAAVMTGLATGTKVIGLFFFLAIPLYLLFGILDGRLTWRSAMGRGAAFAGIMLATIVLSNPFMLLPSQLLRMLRIMQQQSAAMSTGWILAYDKGPGSWMPIIQRLYGQPVFLLLASVALALGIWKGPNRILSSLIAAWCIPFGIYVLFAVAIKPTHFFLPILLPLYSCLPALIASRPFENFKLSRQLTWIWGGLCVAIVAYQAALFLRTDTGLYREVLEREQNSESIVFYRTIEDRFLAKIQSDEPLVVVRDVRSYFPDTPRWIVRSFWNIDYQKVESIKPDVIVLWSQRIADYTQQGALEGAIDPAQFQQMYDFYKDVQGDQVRGYRIIYQGNEGVLLVSEALYEQWFRQQSLKAPSSHEAALPDLRGLSPGRSG